MSRIIRFVHMKKEEIELAKKFLDKLENFIRVETSVKLFPPQEYINEVVEEAIREYAKASRISIETAREIMRKYKIIDMIINNLAKRIDIVVEFDSEIWLVEVKDKLRPSGIGELFTYLYWYKKLYKPTKPVRLVYVVHERDVMIEEVCKYYNIKIIYI